MILNRWIEAIDAACGRALDHDFAWGNDDCCTFACDVVRAVTGRDPMTHLRGSYASRAEAVAAQLDQSGGGLVDTVQNLARAAGFEQSYFPWKGPLVGVVATPNGPVMGVFYGVAWLVRSERGIVRMAPHLGVLAWEVPL